MPDDIRTLRQRLQKIVSQLDELASLAEDTSLLGIKDPSVSAWSVGEQIEHLRRSDLTIIKALRSVRDDGPNEGSPTLAGRAVLLLGFIPRGAGKAPTATQPLEVDSDALSSQMRDVGRGFADLESDFDRLSRCQATIRHPALGHFTAGQMLAFAEIHHRHHLKIIRDIRRSNARAS